MRTITLELLRHGPAHNQLLSPLTPYLALCENHAAVTLHVPFEHNQFLHRLSALGYKFGDESRTFQLHDTARVLGDLLGEIPGLMAESNKASDDGEYLTHLRLIISASELALLPFELALSPGGLPGSGQHLLLQPQMPLCLTREIRRVPGEQLQWPLKPRILFVAAAPPEVGQIPLESHLLALRRLISPWVKYFDESDSKMQLARIDEHLSFLPGASIEAIEQACASGAFTHVHILAHGVERKENYDTRFFLALHSAADPGKAEYISGTRLATALRPLQRPDNEGLAKPVVVTLASCNSGDVGSVAGAGASIAHALHESGIPMVVASQFPLSFEGSVRLVECLYEGLLWGIDPRRLLYDLRRRLYAQFEDKHDWASLTAYVSLPHDFNNQLAALQIDQALRSINAAMNHADEATGQVFKQTRAGHFPDREQTPTEEATSPPGNAQAPPKDARQKFKDARQKLEAAKLRLEKLLTRLPAKKVYILGLLASTEKREAEILFIANYFIAKYPDDKLRPAEEPAPSKGNADALELLGKSRDHYRETFLLDRSSVWAAVQYLSLDLVLRRSKKNQGEAQDQPAQSKRSSDNYDKETAAWWSMAHQLSEYDLTSHNRRQVVWAHGNLMELYLLSLLIPEVQLPVKRQDAAEEALKHADALIDLAGAGSFDVYSTRRQLLRYRGWFNELAPLGSLSESALRVLERFPAEVAEVWE